MRNLDDDEINQHLKNLDVYGYTKIENFLDIPKVNLLKGKLNDYQTAVKDVESYGRPERDAKDEMVYNLQNKDLEFIELLTESSIKKILIPKLNDIHYRFLDNEYPNYILSFFNARSSGLALDLHIDSYIPSAGDYTWVMQVAYILDDMSEKNGSTTLVPGSHKSGKYTDRDLKNVEQIVANSGDVVMWDSRLWHGTSENLTGESRWALIATFNRWWVKQSMDITRSLPNAIYQQLSDEQKLLMGFCSIPPSDESTRIVTKGGYDVLLPSVEDYYSSD